MATGNGYVEYTCKRGMPSLGHVRSTPSCNPCSINNFPANHLWKGKSTYLTKHVSTFQTSACPLLEPEMYLTIE